MEYVGQFNTERAEVKEYRFGECIVRTWKRTDGHWPCSPWLFAIQKDREDERQFTSVSNYCDTRRAAMMRGFHRAKWLNSGEWGKHYSAAPAMPLPGAYKV